MLSKHTHPNQFPQQLLHKGKNKIYILYKNIVVVLEYILKPHVDILIEAFICIFPNLLICLLFRDSIV